jgi:hypothetical protein
VKQFAQGFVADPEYQANLRERIFAGQAGKLEALICPGGGLQILFLNTTPGYDPLAEQSRMLARQRETKMIDAEAARVVDKPPAKALQSAAEDDITKYDIL